MRLSLLLLIALGSGLTGQEPGLPGPATVGSGYKLPSPFFVAPGQLVTLFVRGIVRAPLDETIIFRAPAGTDLPQTLAGISVRYWQGIGRVAPVLEVHPFWTCPKGFILYRVGCASLTAVTIQIPLEAQSYLPFQSGVLAGGQLSVGQDELPGRTIFVTPLADQVHILTSCDTFLTSADYAESSPTGFPCPSIVTHADGSPVSAKSPAKAGEELVAYAVGLGQTTPPSVTGQLVTKSAPTQTTFTLDFNYRPNALPSKPLPTGPQPIFAGTTPGYVGLYQVNFIVPPVPAGTPPCVDASTLPQGSNVVESNLTVSVGGAFSFDGARICVATTGP